MTDNNPCILCEKDRQIGNPYSYYWQSPCHFCKQRKDWETKIVNKASPQNPSNIHMDITRKIISADCPNCGNPFPDIGGYNESYGEVEQYHYCPWCGQRIDWEVNDVLHVKCNGVRGDLVSIEESGALYCGGIPFESVYNVTIRTEDGYKAEFENVSQDDVEIEVINAKTAD